MVHKIILQDVIEFWFQYQLKGRAINENGFLVAGAGVHDVIIRKLKP